MAATACEGRRSADDGAEDIEAAGAQMSAIDEELAASGELVGAEGLTGREAGKIATYDGVGAPVVTDGPFPESKELGHGRLTTGLGAAARERVLERYTWEACAERGLAAYEEVV